MKSELILKFKGMFEEQKKNLIYTHVVLNEEFNLKKDDMLDETDMTSVETETNMRIRLRNREALFLKKINEALARIKDGTFGACEACCEDIEIKRLEARPTTTLCVLCKEEQERRETLHIDGHRHKSVGRLRLA
jgi:DnaK suppressor protein